MIANSSSLSSRSITDQAALPHQVANVKPPVAEVKKMEIAPDVLQKAVDEANTVFSHVRPDIKFVIDEDSKEIVMMLIEPDTGDVINWYPTEQALAISHAITQSQEKVTEQHKIFRHAGDGILGLFVKQKT